MIYSEAEFFKQRERNEFAFYSHAHLFYHMKPNVNIHEFDKMVPIKVDDSRIIYEDDLKDFEDMLKKFFDQMKENQI